MSRSRPCHPPVEALRVSQDRLLEKELFGRLGIPTPPFRAVDSRADLHAAVAALGLPCVLKTRRLGYDGRGQRYLRRPADVDAAWDALGGVPLILEGFVDFDREVSIIGARSTRGETRCYPLAANTHRDGILRVTLAPSTNARLQKAAERHLRRVMDHFGYAGVLTIEFFVQRGRLVANEMAPRVHNSGHWTIEGAVTSQFENHLRAILGLPGTVGDGQLHRHPARPRTRARAARGPPPRLRQGASRRPQARARDGSGQDRGRARPHAAPSAAPGTALKAAGTQGL